MKENTQPKETLPHEGLMENKGESYSIILLNIHDDEGYQKYRKSTEKLMKKAGGYIEREFNVLGQKGNIPNFETPNRIVIIYWNHQGGHEQLMNEKKYQQASEMLKSSASNIRVIKGTSELFQTSDSDQKGRMYIMKLSYYKEHTEGRLGMLNELGPKLAPYGFYTERMVMANEAVGLDLPNEVSIHFHDFAYQNKALNKDQEVLSSIGAYNDKYLTSFMYLPLELR